MKNSFRTSSNLQIYIFLTKKQRRLTYSYKTASFNIIIIVKVRNIDSNYILLTSYFLLFANLDF